MYKDHEIETLYAILEKMGLNPILTGSRACGTETPKSDWDFICKKSRSYKISGYHPFYKQYRPKRLYKSYCGDCNISKLYIIKIKKWWFFTKYKIHLICLNDPAYKNWAAATAYCKMYPERVKNKKDRCKIFDRFS